MKSEEWWDRVTDTFARALELNPEQRDSFLQDVCESDGPLRSEVERLLAEHDKAGDFIVEPLIGSLADLHHSPHQPRFSPGQILGGRFEILRFIDHGGMGEV